MMIRKEKSQKISQKKNQVHMFDYLAIKCEFYSLNTFFQFYSVFYNLSDYNKVCLNKIKAFFLIFGQLEMRNYNDTSYDTLPRTGVLSRSRSQNHYYIQANEFQKRYQNSLINAYRMKNSRKCPPCCNPGDYQNNNSNMTFRQNQKENLRQYDYEQGQYYQTSYFKQEEDFDTVENLQKSKRYLEDLVEKSNFNFKIHKQRTEDQIQNLQKLIQTKDNQIQELNKQISRLKKISLETLPNGFSINQSKQDNTQTYNQAQKIKDLQRKVNRLRQQNSYFREDIEIKNKEIQQQKSKFKLKQESDTNIKKQLQKENNDLKQTKKQLTQKLLWLQKIKKQKQVESAKDKDRIRKLQTELQFIKNKFSQMKAQNQNRINKNEQKIRAIQSQFFVLRQRSRDKDTQIENLLSRISCIQSQLDFFKDKFTNLLFEIERQQRQSATIYQQALSLKQEGLKFYEATSRIKQSQYMELQSQPRSSRMNGNNWFDPVENRLTESIPVIKSTFGKDISIYSPTNKKINKYDVFNNMAESHNQIIHNFPSLNMGFSPIRTNE